MPQLAISSTQCTGKVSVNNSCNKLYANVVSRPVQHDKIISNKGFFTKVNLFNRDGAINQANIFQPNEEYSWRSLWIRISYPTMIIVKAKIPAGFEFVRRSEEP